MNPGLFLSRVSLPMKAQDRLVETRAIPTTQGIDLFTAADGAEPISQHQQEATMQKQIDYDKPMTREEQRAALGQMAPTLSAAASGMPKRHSALSNAVTAQGDGKSEGQGGGQGGQERPSHSSYYNPVPVGGIAMPKRGSTTGDAVIKNEAAVKKSRGLGL